MMYFKREHTFSQGNPHNKIPVYDFWRVTLDEEWIQIQLRGDGEIYFLRSYRNYDVPKDAVECTKEEWQKGFNQMMQRLNML